MDLPLKGGIGSLDLTYTGDLAWCAKDGHSVVVVHDFPDCTGEVNWAVLGSLCPQDLIPGASKYRYRARCRAILELRYHNLVNVPAFEESNCEVAHDAA